MIGVTQWAGMDLVVARLVGNVYSWNTVGAILGAFAGGFVFLSLLGIRTTLVTAIVINLYVALLVAELAPSPLRTRVVTCLLPRSHRGHAPCLELLTHVTRPFTGSLKIPVVMVLPLCLISLGKETFTEARGFSRAPIWAGANTPGKVQLPQSTRCFLQVTLLLRPA